MRKTLVVAAALVMATTVAGLAMKAPSAAAAAAWSWTGFYVGGNIGGGVATSQFGDGCFFCSATTTADGFFTGGGQVGYNYQFGSGLVGIEADVNGNSNFKSGVIGDSDNPALRVRSNIDVSGTIRARGGVVVGNAMIYATGGAAWANIKQTGTEFCNGSPCTATDTANSSGTKWGGVVGAGVEFALMPKVTVGGEFLHTIYADTSANILNASGSSACGNRNCAITSHVTTDVARVRFNYKLN